MFNISISNMTGVSFQLLSVVLTINCL